MFCVDFAGYEEVQGGNPQPKSDSPLQSGLAIRAAALAPWLRAYAQGQRHLNRTVS
jgi:hypothetical protein